MDSSVASLSAKEDLFEPFDPASILDGSLKASSPQHLLTAKKIEALAHAWEDYAVKLQSGERAKHEAARKAVENPSPSLHEMFHSLMHSDYWRPLVAQESNYAGVLREKGRFGHQLLGRIQAAQRIEFADIIRMQYNNMVVAKKKFRKQGSQDYKEEDVDFVMDAGDLTVPPSRRESSYTVHLGGQLKKVMNVRLIAGDPFSFLQRDTKVSAYDPVRLQTWMNLFSSTLQGLVVIVDEWDVWRGIWKDLSSLCSSWPELHFDSFEDQLTQSRALKEQWESGDVLTTRHSNFREVHVLFHVLLTGNKMDLLESEDVNGRHPAVLALRNVMRQVWDFDVSVISLPLLLFRQYHPFMTSVWCQKRAELVFKCVKGFMIEMSTSGSDEAKTVQFLLPDNAPDSIYTEMSEMITTIFRSPNPLMRLST